MFLLAGVATCVDSNPSGDGDKEVEPEHRWTFSEIKRQWRKFSIDLMPKVHHSTLVSYSVLIYHWH